MSASDAHGGPLRDLVVDAEAAQALKEEALALPSWDLTYPQLWDFELLSNGAFSPLEGYLGRDDYDSVLERMRLADGTLWPIPINLAVTPDFVKTQGIADGARVVLRHPEGMPLGTLDVSDIWTADREAEASNVFGTADQKHPGVFHLMQQTAPTYLGGKVRTLELPQHHTFQRFRHTPAALRAAFYERGWNRVVGFQTRNPMHRAHVELVRRAAASVEANLLLHPVVGRTRPGDVDYYSRVRCYEAVLEHLPEQTTMLSLLPLSMRMGGPREALWHAIIRKNYGCTHFIVGRDHAGPGADSSGKPFYGHDDARNLCQGHQEELGIEICGFEELVYAQDDDQYYPRSEVPQGYRVLSLSGSELRQRLHSGREIPSWFSYPEVVAELRRTYPPRDRQGLTVFFTGLSGAGKSTVAQILVAKLLERGGRPVTLLDGDVVRQHLSSELGFSREHRDLNVQRIGYVASEITKNGGIAVCAPIAPYDATRRTVQQMIDAVGGFVLVHVSTPLDVCEARDRKGLYAKARAGLIKGFTGIDDPYEIPQDAEVVMDTSQLTPEEAAQRIILHLEKEGFID